MRYVKIDIANTYKIRTKIHFSYACWYKDNRLKPHSNHFDYANQCVINEIYFQLEAGERKKNVEKMAYRLFGMPFDDINTVLSM